MLHIFEKHVFLKETTHLEYIVFFDRKEAFTKAKK